MMSSSVTTQTKALEEYFLMVVSTLLLNRVHFILRSKLHLIPHSLTSISVFYLEITFRSFCPVLVNFMIALNIRSRLRRKNRRFQHWHVSRSAIFSSINFFFAAEQVPCHSAKYNRTASAHPAEIAVFSELCRRFSIGIIR